MACAGQWLLPSTLCQRLHCWRACSSKQDNTTSSVLALVKVGAGCQMLNFNYLQGAKSRRQGLSLQTEESHLLAGCTRLHWARLSVAD